jgi:predicted nucleic acid-binding protein
VKVVIDSNIVFSALLKTDTVFGQIIFNSDQVFEFCAPHYLKAEVRAHWDKLKKISKLTDRELEEAYESLLTKLRFVNEEVIPEKIWETCEHLLLSVDPDDIAFVALSQYVNGLLWTGDQKLRVALRKKGVQNVISTTEMMHLWTRERLV